MTDHHPTVSVLTPYIVVSDNHPDLDVSEADMQLIAAAPDLLEALIAMYHHFGVLEDNPMLNQEAIAASKKARAAIARATS